MRRIPDLPIIVPEGTEDSKEQIKEARKAQLLAAATIVKSEKDLATEASSQATSGSS